MSTPISNPIPVGSRVLVTRGDPSVIWAREPVRPGMVGTVVGGERLPTHTGCGVWSLVHDVCLERGVYEIASALLQPLPPDAADANRARVREPLGRWQDCPWRPDGSHRLRAVWTEEDEPIELPY